MGPRVLYKADPFKKGKGTMEKIGKASSVKERVRMPQMKEGGKIAARLTPVKVGGNPKSQRRRVDTRGNRYK